MAKIRLTVGSFLGLLLNGIVLAAPGSVLSQWTAEFGGAQSTGLFFNLLLVSNIIGITLATRLRQRHPLMVFAVLLVGVAFVLAAVSSSFQSILSAATLMGLGDGILIIHAASLVGELHPTRRVVMLNWVNAAFGVGAVSVPLIAAFLPWRTTFVIAAIAAFLAVFFVWNAPPVANFRSATGKITWSKTAIFLLLDMIYTGVESALGTWSGSYLVYLGWDNVKIGTLLSLYWTGLIIGQIFLATFVARYPVTNVRWLLVLGFGVLVLSLIPALAPLFVLAAFFYGPIFATLFALVQQRCGHTALGYLSYASVIGKNAIPAGFSLIQNPAHIPLGFIALALLLYLLSFQVQPNALQNL